MITHFQSMYVCRFEDIGHSQEARGVMEGLFIGDLEVDEEMKKAMTPSSKKSSSSSSSDKGGWTNFSSSSSF